MNHDVLKFISNNINARKTIASRSFEIFSKQLYACPVAEHNVRDNFALMSSLKIALMRVTSVTAIKSRTTIVHGPERFHTDEHTTTLLDRFDRRTLRV